MTSTSLHRTQETNLGNLVTDVMRRATRADVALLNSGTFRSDTVHDAGVFRMKVGRNLHPFFRLRSILLTLRT